MAPWTNIGGFSAERLGEPAAGAGGGQGGVLYLQKIEELEAENARLEEQAWHGAALYVPKIQELESDLLEAQQELEQALEDQRALQQDLAAKGSVIRELLRRSGLTAGPSRVRRMLGAAVGGGGGFTSNDGGENIEPVLTLGEL